MPSIKNNATSQLPGKGLGISWPMLVAAVALMGVLGIERFGYVLADPDTYWHLAAGRWMIEHGAVPRSDPFSHTMPGAAWSAHEWLSELVLSGVYQTAGWAGLRLVVGLVFAGTLGYLTRFLLARMEPVHALLFVAFTAGMLMSHLLARPHMLVWPLLAVWTGTLVNAGETRRGPPWQLLPLMTLWANLHGSFTLGLALGAALALDAVLNAAPERRRIAALRWLAFTGLSFSATLITPWGWQGLLYSFQVSQLTYALSVIGEWLSPNFHYLQSLELWLMLILFLACTGRLRLRWLRLAIFLALTHLALKHLRHVSILGLVTPFLIAAPLGTQWRTIKAPGRDVETLDRFFHAIAQPVRRSAIIIAALVAVLPVWAFLRYSNVTPPGDRTPEAAIQAGLRAGATGPVINSYDFGGYLIFKDIPVFIDGRADMYGDAFLKRFMTTTNLLGPDRLQDLLDEYHIGWTLFPPGTPALALLDQLPEWRRVYTDKIAVVHIRAPRDHTADLK